MCVGTRFVFILMERWRHLRQSAMRWRNSRCCFAKNNRFAGMLSRVSTTLQIKLQPGEGECKQKRCDVIVIRMGSLLTTVTLMRGEETGAGRHIFVFVRLVLMMGQAYRQRKEQRRTSWKRRGGKGKIRVRRERRFGLREPRCLKRYPAVDKIMQPFREACSKPPSKVGRRLSIWTCGDSIKR